MFWGCCYKYLGFVVVKKKLIYYNIFIYIAFKTIISLSVGDYLIAIMPFCKICFDAKRRDYLEHNIKVWNNAKKMFEISCTYLKNIVCSNCGEKGHTMKYCSANINTLFDSAKKVYQTRNSDNTNKNKNRSTSVKNSNSICQPILITSNNRFNILDDDESGKIDNNISSRDNVYKISYTYEGEVIGNVDDIIWGYRLNGNSERWSDYV